MKCSICNYEMRPWPGGKGYGNNAEPINSGRCCDMCNWTKVIPERIRRINRGDYTRTVQDNGPRE